MLKSQPGTPRLCLPTGEWSGEPASCKVKTCRYTEVTSQTAAGSRHACTQRVQVRQLQGQDMQVDRGYMLDSCRVKTCSLHDAGTQRLQVRQLQGQDMQVHRDYRVVDSCRVNICRQTKVTGQTATGLRHAGRYTEVQLCMFSKLLNCHIKTCKDTDTEYRFLNCNSQFRAMAPPTNGFVTCTNNSHEVDTECEFG